MNLIENLYNSLRNATLNAVGVNRDLIELLEDRDISKAKDLFQNRDEDVKKAIEEYNPDTHPVMARPDKLRKNKEQRAVQKLPRKWQQYINEVALFFMLANPVRWIKKEGDDEAFKLFLKFLEDTRFNTTMRQAKRLAGAETESAKIYNIFRNEETGEPEVKVLVVSRSEGYILRPLFDQYKTLLAFGLGYYLKETTETVEHFDIYTPEYIYRCKNNKTAWAVEKVANPSKKINVIYYQQPKEWDGVVNRIERDEMLDSKSADINDYFADPMVKATADVISALADPDSVGKIVHLTSKDSAFEYIEPPTASEMKDGEKKILKESILYDTFTPDFSMENMKGMGELSGEAMKRAMILGFIKRDNRKEIYDISVDREKNLIMAIMQNVTHVSNATALKTLQVGHEFAEPFADDVSKKWAAIGTAVSDRIISVDTAVEMLAVAKDVKGEIERIKADVPKTEPLKI